MPKREPQSWEMVLKRNSVERLKHDLFPTELTGQWDRLVETSYEKLPEGTSCASSGSACTTTSRRSAPS